MIMEQPHPGCLSQASYLVAQTGAAIAMGQAALLTGDTLFLDDVSDLIGCWHSWQTERDGVTTG